MKLIIGLMIFSVLGGLVLIACNHSTKTKKENTMVTTENRPVTAFSKLSVEGIFPVQISQDGSAEFVKVETAENLQQHIKVSQQGDRLFITMDKDVTINKSEKMKVYVNIKNLTELDFKSVGALTTSGQLKLDSLELSSESVGKLTLDVEAKYLRTNLNSVGATTLRGKVGEVRINNKSVGTLSAYDLKAGTLMIHNTAIGTAEVYADSAFYIRSSAIGTLSYKGPGVVKELSSEGIGKVSKVN
jgi:hypothetical protein